MQFSVAGEQALLGLVRATPDATERELADDLAQTGRRVIRSTVSRTLFTYRGGTAKEAFVTYVREVLLPELEPGDAMVLDPLAAHKDPRVRDWVEGAGAKLYFMPPYSPDLNPIELARSWVKRRWLKTSRARTEPALNLALGMAMERVGAVTASRWIRHRGYENQAE